jgi:formate dehydrogenase major subunit
MTNCWTDMANTSMVLVWGANPVENHPASMAHINKARANGATLVVVDPRKTRTALQADRYIRIRPGTDIALQNAVIGGIIADMEARDVADAARVKFFAFLNQAGNGSFYSDGDSTPLASTLKTTVPFNSKYTDARFIVNAAGSDYDREKILASTGAPAGSETADLTISNFPKKAATCGAAGVRTVYNLLKAHVAPYDNATVADICGCTTADIEFLVAQLIANGRCSSPAEPIGLTAGTQDPRVAGYKATTILYAMGMTQHTNASTGIKGFANIQTLMGNMGRAGGGINALRGIHNVQGSTDMGLLYGNIPAYSANPSVKRTDDIQAFGKYMNALWGYPLSGTAVRTKMDGSYDDAYATGAMGLQQRGFYNMTRAWFGDPAWASTVRTQVDNLYDLWPKGNGDDHVSMFRAMAGGSPVTKAAIVWGQNPAVTEPNQSAVRKGLENLDMLVVVDNYETETAACDRKPAGVTYLLPACSYVEEAGSVTNSGRALQWRERSTLPKGNSKADIELLLRLAYALDKPAVNAFAHLKAVWALEGYAATSAYASLYGTRYGWTPTAGVDDFDAVTSPDATNQVWTGTSTAPSAAGVTLTGSEAICERIFREEMSPVASGGTLWIYTGAFNSSGTWATDNLHPSIGTATTGDKWLVYNRAKSRDNRNGVLVTGTNAYGGWGYAWLVNRRVFYNNGDIPGDVADYFMGPDSVSRLFVSNNAATLNYSRWYRTIHKLVDMPDVCFPQVGSDSSKNGIMGTPTAYHILPGRFPAFTEPYETPKADDAAYMAKWGRNTKGTGAWDLVKADTNVAGKTVGFPAATYPLVLTTIRCVEHFQGGPTTRNNSWNVEAEPVPWIEINAADARTYGIADGNWVNVTTARSDSVADQLAETPDNAVIWAKGFKARVGVGLESNQRVARGVVAIPWHWADKGLSTGSRANDLCIDAGDANSVIPEYKACLCKINKINV